MMTNTNDPFLTTHDDNKADTVAEALVMEHEEDQITAKTKKRVLPFYPPAPARKYFEKRWREWSQKERNNYQRRTRAGEPGYTYRAHDMDGRVMTPEYVVWKRDCEARRRAFHGFDYHDRTDQWLKDLMIASPQEREAMFQKAEEADAQREASQRYFDELGHFLETCTEEEFRKWKYRQDRAAKDEDPEALSKALQSHREAIARATGGDPLDPSFTVSDLYHRDAQDILTREPATMEEMKAINAYVSAREKMDGIMSALEAGGLGGPDLIEAEKTKTAIAKGISRTKTKLVNLSQGYDDKARQKAKDAKRKDDPERKAANAARAKAYRERKKAMQG